MKATPLCRSRIATKSLLLLAACGSPPPTPRETPPDAVTTGIARAVDGLDIAFDVRGHGETALVFVHCWACDRTFWREQLDAFADRYRVVLLDFGGHGDFDAVLMEGVGHFVQLERPSEFNQHLSHLLDELLSE